MSRCYSTCHRRRLARLTRQSRPITATYPSVIVILPFERGRYVLGPLLGEQVALHCQRVDVS